MKRRAFLQSSVVAGVAVNATTLNALPLVQQPSKSILVKAGEDRKNKPFSWVGADFTVKVSGADCENRCEVFDTIRREKKGPPLHLHTNCDEWFYISEGEFKFQVGEQTSILKTGDSLIVPRNIPHAFVKISEGDAKMIVMHQPAVDMEGYFRIVSDKEETSIDARRALAEKYGMKILGPPLKA